MLWLVKALVLSVGCLLWSALALALIFLCCRLFQKIRDGKGNEHNKKP